MLKTELNVGKKIETINTWAVPTLTYPFGVIKWPDTELKEVDRATRKFLIGFRMHHPHASLKDCIFLVDPWKGKVY